MMILACLSMAFSLAVICYQIYVLYQREPAVALMIAVMVLFFMAHTLPRAF